MYAIVNISGKQFKAEKGSKLCVPKQSLEEGKKLIIDEELRQNMVDNAYKVVENNRGSMEKQYNYLKEYLN